MSQAGAERPSYDELAALVVEQARTITELRADNERLRAEVGKLSVRVVELERRLGRNSGNSSLPPSAGTFTRPQKPPAAKSGRKRGRQPGAGGGGLAMVERADKVEDHLPPACAGCGAGLELADSIAFERRQVRDIPLVTVAVTEHRAHRCQCACGATTRAVMPEQVAGSPTSYGPNLRALVARL
ncbi:DUF6444 domain-containing protein [Streptosporangium subroseum]|uniref:DUF6444 domain-containing protein n=1 Tax=Streptosporangium subroseum TaxID=106412 RepID=UPI003420C639